LHIKQNDSSVISFIVSIEDWENSKHILQLHIWNLH